MRAAHRSNGKEHVGTGQKHPLERCVAETSPPPESKGTLTISSTAAYPNDQASDT